MSCIFLRPETFQITLVFYGWRSWQQLKMCAYNEWLGKPSFVWIGNFHSHSCAVVSWRNCLYCVSPCVSILFSSARLVQTELSSLQLIYHPSISWSSVHIPFDNFKFFKSFICLRIGRFSNSSVLPISKASIFLRAINFQVLKCKWW